MNDKTKKIIKQITDRREISLLVLLAILLVPITIRSPSFLSSSNLSVIFNDMAILVIVSIGQFFVILSNGIDLSVGSIIAFTGMACGMMNESHPGFPAFMLLFMGIAIGLVLGLFKGILVAFGKIPPMLATLGTMSIYRGLTFVLSKGTWVTAHEMSLSYIALPRISILGISSLIWIAAIVVAVMYYITNYTQKGRAIYAIGGNPVAAKFVGVSERKTRIITFLLSGALCGLAGALWTARYASAVNEMATGFEMQTVASCVLGGVNFAGGAGGIIGVVMGSLFLGVIKNALPVIYLSTFWQTFVEGLVVLFALSINTIIDNKKQRALLAQRRR